MQQFIRDSPWDHLAVMGQVAEETEATLGGAAETALYVDESSFAKKGGRIGRGAAAVLWSVGQT